MDDSVIDGLLYNDSWVEEVAIYLILLSNGYELYLLKC